MGPRVAQPAVPLRLRRPHARPRRVGDAAQRRTLLGLACENKAIVIKAQRVLPYARPRLYDLIVDVDAYSTFLPYCKGSCVTAWSDAASAADPDMHVVPIHPASPFPARRWPVEAQLTVGFGPVRHSYTSRIECVPGRSVEARSGSGSSSSSSSSSSSVFFGGDSSGGGGGIGNALTSLVTRWTVEDAVSKRAGRWTRVGLDLHLQVADPLLRMMVAGAVDETADRIIEAFERRARELFGAEP